MNIDCGFTKGNLWFRYRVAAIIIEENSILFAKNDIDDYYYSIGGACQIGEKAEDAIKREVLEETGINYEIDRLVFIHENFFIGSGSLDGNQCHEVAFYFLMKSRGTKELNSNSFTLGGVREYMHWLDIDKLDGFKAFPNFFNDKLKNLNSNIEHIITYEY